LFKKAHELSVLCSVDVAVIIFGNNKKLYEYSSSDIGEILTRYQYVSSPPTFAGFEANGYSMEEPTNIRVLPILVGRERWMMMTTTMMDLVPPITAPSNPK
jgi:MADS-box transcription factor